MFFLLFKRKSKKKALRVVLLYILYCIFNEGLSYYLQSIHSESFRILLYTFTIVEYSFICYFIYLIFPVSFIKKSVIFIWASFILFAFIDLMNMKEKGVGFDSFAIGIESIIILLLCISFLFIQIKGSNNLFIYSTFNFWVVITFLIYFAGTFFVYLLTSSMSESVAFQREYFIINISFNILKDILLCVAMTMKSNDVVNEQKSGIPDLDEDLFISKKIN